MTFLYVLLFLVLLSIVVSLHELGHYSIASIFNVYCAEFSIGFGPKIFRKRFKYKRKKPLFNSPNIEPERILPCRNPNYEYIQSETYFSVGVIPLGGYVLMAGEQNIDLLNKEIPVERTIEGINHLKQIMIFLAGVFTNFLLALVLLFVNYSSVKQVISLGDKSNEVMVSESSLISEKGISSYDRILYAYQEYHNLEGSSDIFYFPQNGYGEKLDKYLTYKEGTSYLSPTCVSYAVQDCFLYKYYSSLDSSHYSYPEEIKNYSVKYDSYRLVHIKYQKQNSDDILETSIKCLTQETQVGNEKIKSFQLLGISPLTKEERLGIKQAFITTGSQFGNLFTSLYKGLFSIFTPTGWKQTGGIIAVYQVTTDAFKSSDISYFLLIWAYISINLGCFNLLPFPGLDGWQCFIALTETVTRRKISLKVRGIINAIGLILLFAFAGLLIVKDIIRFII